MKQHAVLQRIASERSSYSSSARLIAASAKQVWKQLLTTEQIAPGEIDGAWMYRIGVPSPLSAKTELRDTELRDTELVRHIAMGGNIHQASDDWEANRRVRWTYRFTEDSISRHVLDDHVMIGGAYFDLIDTEFSLAQRPGGSELSVRMRYRVSTRFEWYAAPVAQFFASNFTDAALALYARRAEASQGRTNRQQIVPRIAVPVVAVSAAQPRVVNLIK